MFLDLPCPGCGLLHALWAVGHLDFQSAFAFFPIWPLFFLFAFWRRSRAVAHLFVGALFLQWLVRLW